MPKQQRSKDTVDVILAATARVLVKEGFDRASTNRIAEQAGVSIGSLYQYFPSKEALVAALVERHIETMSEALEAEMAALADAPLDLLVRRMVMLMLDAHAVDPELHRVLNEQVPRVGRLHRVHEVEARMQRLGRAWFERRRGELRPGLDLDTAAFVVVQAIEALTHGAMIHGETAPPRDALVEEISTLVLRYLAP
ncbi:MAG: TetR/AcrR family transcriptional regulator [Polyangia bacterium]